MAALGLALAVLCLPLVFTYESRFVHFVTNTPVIPPSRELTIRCSIPVLYSTNVWIAIVKNTYGSGYFSAFTLNGDTVATYTDEAGAGPDKVFDGIDDYRRGFLEVTWYNPVPLQTGFYNCSTEIAGMKVWKGLTIS